MAKLKTGTKSILFGAHQFLIHPLFLFVAWWKLYGFPKDPRLWVAFFVHDLGYWGKPKMDDEDGENHVVLGATIMSYLFGSKWGNLCLYHSRFKAKKDGVKPSRLCVADKLVIAMVPWWIYLPLVRMTGELSEYMDCAEKKEGAKYATMNISTANARTWYKDVQAYIYAWVLEHKDGKADTWTPVISEPKGE